MALFACPQKRPKNVGGGAAPPPLMLRVTFCNAPASITAVSLVQIVAHDGRHFSYSPAATDKRD